jgi:MerR family mercuric resistance operon transcriptional regulator
MQESTPMMTIGVLSRQTGCKVETIRYYEQTGLVTPPLRSAGGHRQFDGGALKRLDFILKARRLGFSLDTVRTLLDLAGWQGESCADVEAVANGHLAEVRTRLSDLAALETALADMVHLCRGGTMPDCPIIEALSDRA